MPSARPEVWAGDNAMLGQWPTIAILWLITAVFFDWVIQSTGMGVTQAAIVLTVGGIIVFGPLAGWMFGGAAAGVCLSSLASPVRSMLGRVLGLWIDRYGGRVPSRGNRP